MKYESACEMIVNRIEIREEGGCWFWIGRLSDNGYGEVHKNYWGKYYKVSRAHQLSYIIFRGDYNRNLMILHSCNNRNCVNPNHLRVGTAKDNMDDRSKVGSFNSHFNSVEWKLNPKNVKGEDVATSKLTEKQVLEIKELLDKGIVFQKEIAEEYNVHQVTVSKIKLGKIWRHI